MSTDRLPVASLSPDVVAEKLRPRARRFVRRAQAVNERIQAGSLSDAADGASESSASERLRDGKRLVAELEDLTQWARGQVPRSAPEIADAALERALMHPSADGPQVMNAAEARAFREKGVDIAEATDRLGQAVAADPKGGSALKALRESAEWRRVVKGGARNEHDEGERAASATESRDDQFADFAPLLRWISAEASPSLKAELTARMELYVLSGHALRDCVEPVDPAHPQTPAAAAMRALHERWKRAPRDAGEASMLEGEADDPARQDRAGSLSIIAERFAEIFHPLRVERIETATGEVDWIARTIPRAQSAETMLRRAGSGEVDAVLRDARDPSKLLMAVATADESTFIENNQAFRHYRAITNAIAAGEIEGVREVRALFCLPSLLYGQTAPDGKELRGDFIASRVGALTSVEREALNAMPSISQVARVDRGFDQLGVSLIAQFELCLIGASADGLNQRMHDVRAIADAPAQREAALTVLGETVATALDALVRKDPATPLMKSSGANRPMLGSFCEALEGVSRHAIDCPKAVEALQARHDQFGALCAQLTGDSEMLGRIRDQAHKYDPEEGGFAAYAERQLRREAKERAARDALMAAQRAAIATPAGPTSTQSAVIHSEAPSMSTASPVIEVADTARRPDARDSVVRAASANPDILWAAQREQIAYRDARYAALCDAIGEAAGERDALSDSEIHHLRGRLEREREAMGEPLTRGDRGAFDRCLTPFGVAVALGDRRNAQLVQAAAIGDQERVVALLERGADPNATHKGISVIGAARAGGHYDVADLVGEVLAADVAADRRALEQAMRASATRGLAPTSTRAGEQAPLTREEAAATEQAPAPARTGAAEAERATAAHVPLRPRRAPRGA